jgi:Dyp-type peroxidase family
MWSDQNSTDAEPQLEIDDIQGDILVGLPKDFEWFIFFTIQNPEKFKKFARDNLVTRITSTAEALTWESALQTVKGGTKLPLIGLNVALTKSGLKKLGVSDTVNDDSFDRGMANQTADLHGVIMITGPTQEAVDRVHKQLTDNRDGWSLVSEECGQTRPNNHRSQEHFGFRDGISQPGIRGKVDRILPSRQFLCQQRNPNNSAQGVAGSPLVWPGEFVFGYPSATEDNTETPDGPGRQAAGGPPWTRNGSLMVINRFRQLVQEFNKLINDNELVAAKIVGRWKSGAPLSRAPIQDNPTMGSDALRNNDFDFDGDPSGGQCPLTAHIRKVYPRNSNTTYSRRLIRRGIPFGPEVTAEEEEAGRSIQQRGLMFVCYQASIKEQFEYVNHLINDTPKKGERTDALVGQGKEGFIELTDGGYFFMPSITTFKNFVAEEPQREGRLGRKPIQPEPPLEFDPSDWRRLFPERKGQPIPPPPLEFEQSDWRQVLLRLRDLFNAGDYDGMRPLLDVNITWKRLHHADAIVGAGRVIQWLKEEKASLTPQFIPNPGELKPAALTGDGSILIKGPGRWQKDRSKGKSEDIKYYFTFTREGGRWFLTNAFAILD